ncbi:chemotaxis protein, partial [Bacillus cereus]|uniref:hypothetical protein n=1 Tax=Bacillus cereus TaxID=1396 RepID=UPI001C2CC661
MSHPPAAASGDLPLAFAQAIRASQAFIELDGRGHVVAAHPAVLEMTEHAEADVIGHHYRSCFPRAAQWLDACFATDTAETVQTATGRHFGSWKRNCVTRTQAFMLR